MEGKGKSAEGVINTTQNPNTAAVHTHGPNPSRFLAYTPRLGPPVSN